MRQKSKEKNKASTKQALQSINKILLLCSIYNHKHIVYSTYRWWLGTGYVFVL